MMEAYVSRCWCVYHSLFLGERGERVSVVGKGRRGYGGERATDYLVRSACPVPD